MKVGKIDIEWLGHASFLIKGSVIIYVDPWVLSGDLPKADLILITHDHFDHCDPEKVKQIQKEDTVIVTITPAGRKLRGNIRTTGPGESFEIKGVSIKIFASYNIDKFRSPGAPYHPKGLGIGFVFTIDGTTIYHPGDTDFIPEMKNLGKIDIALLPIGGTYTMDASEAAEAAVAIKPKIVIPMHYGTLRETPGDPQKFKNAVKSKNENIDVRILG